MLEFPPVELHSFKSISKHTVYTCTQIKALFAGLEMEI